MVYAFADSLMRLEVSCSELFDSHLKVHDTGCYWRQEVGKGAVACEVETSKRRPYLNDLGVGEG